MTATVPAAGPPLPGDGTPASARATRAVLHGLWDGLVWFGAAMAGVGPDPYGHPLPDHPHDIEGR